MPSMARYLTPVLRNRPVADQFYELEFHWPAAAPAPSPGQFLTVRTGQTSVPLLRRPFAFSRYDPEDNSARIIYQLRGTATAQLAAKRPFDSLDVLGPLGHAFPLPDYDSRPILVAGGIGIGPVLFLARTLISRGHPLTPRLILGARTRVGLPVLLEQEYGEVIACTDDGSYGCRGSAIDALQSYLSTTSIATGSGESVLYLCGPQAMLAAGHRLATECGIVAYAALEQTMGCAVGACMGCAVRVRSREQYARVCTEGPVFDTRMVDWERSGA